MDHRYIYENNIVSLYLTGKLSPHELSEFEEHFVDCRECLDQIEQITEFRRTLKRVVKEEAASRGTAPQPSSSGMEGFNYWLQPQRLAYVGLVMFLALAAGFLAGNKHRQLQLAEEKKLTEEWQRRYADERQTREDLEKQLGQSPDHSQLAANLPPAPLFSLNVTRGSDEGNPTSQISIPQNSKWIVLSLEFEKDPAFHSYCARLNNAGGKLIWSAENIPALSSDAIAVTLPSNLLSKGDYFLTIEGLTAAGEYAPAAHFSFHATVPK
jgi:hypothetical protein